jgi:hypothetical protein
LHAAFPFSGRCPIVAGMNEGDFLWKLIIVLTAVGNLIGIGIAIWTSMRRLPPLPEELQRDFLRKIDHDTLCAAMASRFAALDTHNSEVHESIFRLIREEREWATAQIQQTTAANHQDSAAVERALGRVEGELKRIANGGSP